MTTTPTPEFRMIYANDNEVRDFTFRAQTLARAHEIAYNITPIGYQLKSVEQVNPNPQEQ
jgi:hypothetical protein